MTAQDERLRRLLSGAAGPAALRCQSALRRGAAEMRVGPALDAQTFVSIYGVRHQRALTEELREGLGRVLAEVRKLPSSTVVEIAIIEGADEAWQLVATDTGIAQVLALPGLPKPERRK